MNRLLNFILYALVAATVAYAQYSDVGRPESFEAFSAFEALSCSIDSDTLDFSSLHFESTTDVHIFQVNDTAFFKIENETSNLYSWKGDTLFCVREGAPGKLFKAIEPSMIYVNQNRTFIQRDCLYRGNVSSGYSAMRAGVSTLGVSQSKTIILPECDTVNNASVTLREEFGFMRDLDSCMMQSEVTVTPVAGENDSITYTVKNISILCDGYNFPVLEFNEYRLYCRNQCVDSTFYTRYVPLYNQVVEPNIRINNKPAPSAPTGNHNGNNFSDGASQVYPTIFQNEISVDLRGAGNNSCEIVVADIQGRVWYSDTLPGGDYVEIAAEHYPPGYYLVTLAVDSEVFTYKLYKP